jgi:SAM-dependent methyltransferase
MRSESQEWQDNLQYMLIKLEQINNLPKEKTFDKHLHVGCGKNVLEGFINIDKYFKHPEILPYDMFELPFEHNSIDTIYSSHSLEHLPIRQAKLALLNWHKLLKGGGMLYLAIPDLEEIMLIMTDPTVDDERKEYWYMYTLFGYQADCSDLENAYRLDIPIDYGQFHQCGFSKSMISRILTTSGFSIEKIMNYDGYATPSIWIEARKVR